jgi:hypothetical protein
MGQQQMSGTEFHGTLGRQNEEEDSGRDQLLEQKPSLLQCLGLCSISSNSKSVSVL